MCITITAVKIALWTECLFRFRNGILANFLQLGDARNVQSSKKAGLDTGGAAIKRKGLIRSVVISSPKTSNVMAANAERKNELIFPEK